MNNENNKPISSSLLLDELVMMGVPDGIIRQIYKAKTSEDKVKAMQSLKDYYGNGYDRVVDSFKSYINDYFNPKDNENEERE